MKVIRRLRRMARLVSLGLMVAAISQEMSKPEGERTWHGRVGGLVPYDFRPPTWERIRAAYWNPSDPRLFTERVMGVGWSLNLYRARELMRDGFSFLMGSAPALPARRRSSRPSSSSSSSGSGSRRKAAT
jgi:hypothetical protein